MFSTLRTRFGIPGVISVIALVFAMLGGAYAASNSGDGKKASASAKAKKGPRGPKGATGPAGPAGPAGLAGPAGAAGRDGLNGLDGEDGEDGEDGDNGNPGTNGTDGADGKSVTVAAENTGTANCGGLGGSSFEAEGSGTKQYACNGEEGSPWTAGGTLPPGETQTGAWSLGQYPVPKAAEGIEMEIPFVQTTPISFAIPLAEPLEVTEVHYLAVGETLAGICTGSAANPTAEPGHLCVYTGNGQGFMSFGLQALDGGLQPFGSNLKPGASVSGSVLQVGVSEGGAFGYGSWAVTAPTS